jgi:hypothetical protein
MKNKETAEKIKIMKKKAPEYSLNHTPWTVRPTMIQKVNFTTTQKSLKNNKRTSNCYSAAEHRKNYTRISNETC